MNELLEKTEQLHEERTSFGFWIYLMTDLIMFGVLFATFAVLRNNIADGPSAKEIFSLPFVLTETIILLTSSFTAGLAELGAKDKDKHTATTWLTVTLLLGISFLTMELTEFTHLVHEGSSWQTSAFLSSFFTLVGTHGLHIFVGLFWISTLLVQIHRKGLTAGNARKLSSLTLFWHFLDLVWIFIFTYVYLMGVL